MTWTLGTLTSLRLMILLAALVVLRAPVAYGQENTGAGEEPDLPEIDRQLNNPLTSLWSLAFQDNLGTKEGDLIEDSTYTNLLFFQPALPVPVGKDLVLIARPVFPLVTVPNPNFTTGDVDGHTTGFGDIQMFSLLGPSKATGWVWGGWGYSQVPDGLRTRARRREVSSGSGSHGHQHGQTLGLGISRTTLGVGCR